VFARNLQLFDGEAVFPLESGGEIKIMKIIKNIFIYLLLILPSLCVAQYVTFTKDNNDTNPIVIPSNEVWQLVTYSYWAPSPYNLSIYSSTNNAAQWLGSLSYPGGQIMSQDGSSAGSGSSAGAIFVGPACIKIEGNVSNYFFNFKKILSTSSTTLSATAVVIPQSAAGDVDVKLEQSADNVTWTECLPGTYNSSTVKRFFRLRAVEK